LKFLLDSCISAFAVKVLRAAAHDVVWIPESGGDPGDEAILKSAFGEERILVTADKDFGELVHVFRKPHPAIIRLVDMPARDQGATLLKVIATHATEIEQRGIITVEQFRVRVRLPE
jgi:predicted nuclease of predicted toxin-antitoxin system